ncbi:MAG: cobyrinate a,c-diamide synthase [Acidobacteriota bacterium]
MKKGFLVAGTQSGCGKTTIALGLMAAFRSRGLRVQPFKVGPDFIDPGFHTRIAGRESRNLDGWMLRPDYNRDLFRRLLAEADLAVVEGVMGLYDGYDGLSEAGSSAEMAKLLDLPAVLVVDARSMARSAAALVYGFKHFDPRLRLAGVIFNRIGGAGHLEYLREAMSASLPDVQVFGGIPREEELTIPERHLGLVTADEIVLSGEWQKKLAQMVERYVDLDGILACSERASDSAPSIEVRPPRPERVPIAVARDAAYCFYYPDNFDLLRDAGAEIRFFSPLAGETFPEDTAGLYLGGGYPELFAERLSKQPFVEAIRSSAAQGMPIYAECGGLMTLGRFIDTVEGERWPMAGLLPFGTRMLKRRKALGYTQVTLSQPCLLGEQGSVLRGHEFHYSEVVDEGVPVDFAYEISKRKFSGERPEGYMAGSVLASYVHLHWGSAPEAPKTFVERCLEYQAKR